MGEPDALAQGRRHEPSGGTASRSANELFCILDGELDLPAFEPRTRLTGD
jgi:hypothetical protein